MTFKTLKNALSWGRKKEVEEVFRKTSGKEAVDVLTRAAKQANKDQRELMEKYKQGIR